MTDDFTGLPIGTRLDDQLPGIKFLKYGGMVGGIVVDTRSGHVASFNDAPGCEFAVVERGSHFPPYSAA